MKGVKGILLMGGQGKRFNPHSPKQFHLLAGKKIYLWTLELFVTSNLFDQIILVAPPEKVAEVQKEIGSDHCVVAGGKTRQESSYKGLLSCGPETKIVVIHDAVRPFVSQRILRENIEGAKSFGAINTCIPSSDTIVHVKNDSQIDKIPNRSEYLRGQTPQSFAYPLILKAHEKSQRINSTDDCSLILDQGGEVYLVEGEESNFKITTHADLLIAETFVKKLSNSNCPYLA